MIAPSAPICGPRQPVGVLRCPRQVARQPLPATIQECADASDRNTQPEVGRDHVENPPAPKRIPLQPRAGHQDALAGAFTLGRLPDAGRIEQAVAAQPAAAGAEPDLILVNARVLTSDTAAPRAEAFAVKNGRFTAVGSTSPALPGEAALPNGSGAAWSVHPL